MEIDDSFQKSPRNNAVLSLGIETAQGRFCFNCEFLSPSHSHFRSDSAFHHPNPAFSRLFVIVEGCAEITMDETRHRLRKGDIALLPADHPFYALYHAETRIKAYHLHLTDGLGFHLGPGLKTLRKQHDEVLAEAVLHMLELRCESATQSLMASLLLPLLADEFQSAAERLAMPQFYQALLREMNRTPPARLRLLELAKKYNLSRSALGKAFRRHTGVSFLEYRHNLLLTQAKKLLLDRNLTIAQVADELGFERPFYFFSFFRDATGLTPTRFREGE